MSNKYFLVFLAFLFSVSVYSQHGRHRNSLISGRVMSTEKEVVDFATVYLKGTNQGCYTDEKGIYHLKTTAGEYTLVVSAIGYQTVEKKVKISQGRKNKSKRHYRAGGKRTGRGAGHDIRSRSCESVCF